MNQKQQLEKDIQALEAKLNEMKATVEAMPSDAHARWVPKDQQQYFILDDILTVANRSNLNPKLTERHLSVGNVHRTIEDAEAYRLRLESFVPALGPETPSFEVLKEGWLVEFNGTVEPVNAGEALCPSYQDGTWLPTREAAEAWLAKYGKVRGYTND